ncbi:MAG: acyltransferase family protein, partial [Acidimicrobiia bacterium]
RLHRRLGFRVLIVLALIASLVDLIRLVFDVPYLGYVNFGSVWLFAHQLGFFYGDGSLAKMGRRAYSLMALGGLAALVLLTNVGPYPNSMVGLPGDRVSNMDPPSVCIIALTVWQVGLVMLLRDGFSRWLSSVRVWASVIALNAVIMTMFLWHLTAFLIAVLVLYPIGFPQPLAGSGLWWGLRPVWVLGLMAFLAPFVLVFGRFERAPAVERTPA